MDRASARKFVSLYFEAPVVAVLERVHLTPNAVTVLGLIGTGISAFLLAKGYLLAGGAAMLAAGILDLFDGALARATGKATRSGALVDSVCDRVSEAVVLVGILLFFLARPSILGAALTYAALVGSQMVSYVRARAEGLDIECKVGLMTRPERVVILGLGMIIGQWWLPALYIVLAVTTVFTSFTTIQRVVHVLRISDRMTNNR